MKNVGTARIITFLFILSFMFSLTAFPVKAKSSLLTIDKAISLGIENDADLNNLNMEKLKTVSALEKARSALLNFRKKDTETKFALPISYDLPEKDDRNKDIEVIFKIPQLQATLNELDLKIADAKRKVLLNVRNQYLSIFSVKVDIDRLKAQIVEDEADYKKLEGKFKIGQVDADTLKEAQKDFKMLNDKYKLALKSMEKQKNSLDALIGLEIDDSYTFEIQFFDVDLNEKVLKELVASVKKNDLQIYTARKELNSNRLKTEILLQDSRNQFGTSAEGMSKLLNSKEKIDTNKLMDEYKKVYAQFEGTFVEACYIPFGIFSISLPKKWVGGELAGVTCFANSDNGFPLSAAEREKSVKGLEKVINEQTEAMENLIIELTNARNTYQEAEMNTQAALKEYDKAIGKFKLGKVTGKELLTAKKAVRTALDDSIEGIVSYNKMLNSIDYEASGALAALIGEYTLSLDALIKGETFSKAAKTVKDSEAIAPAGQWNIKNAINDIKVVFGINKLPKGVNADEYELYTYNWVPIGTRCKLGVQTAVLPVAFNKSSLLHLKLFKEGKLIGEAELDGFENGGDMMVTPPKVED